MSPTMMTKVSLTCLFLCMFPSISHGAEKKQLKKSVQTSIQVNGTFEVWKIETKKFSRSDSVFKRIYFRRAPTGTGPKEIFLDSLHVHPALKVGSSFELSAEINPKVEFKKAKEALQILLFIPQNGRKISVWLLSLKSKDLDLRGASYFKMHNPDFIIL
ncbi:MAG: hypothetical protein HRU09_03915 [Oligoflexales bacterium]|nr:hypothetical protein [Oligoflexales bacterium]